MMYVMFYAIPGLAGKVYFLNLNLLNTLYIFAYADST